MFVRESMDRESWYYRPWTIMWRDFTSGWVRGVSRLSMVCHRKVAVQDEANSVDKMRLCMIRTGSLPVYKKDSAPYNILEACQQHFNFQIPQHACGRRELFSEFTVVKAMSER